MTAPNTLSWGIKASLRAYVESLEDGTIELVAPALRDGENFLFSLDAEASSFDEASQTGELQFRGTVNMVGHWGSMRIEIHDPRIILSGESGELAVLVTSVLVEDRYHSIAKLTQLSEGEPLTYQVRLEPAGVSIFGGQYQVGQEVDPVTLSFR